MIFLGVGPIDLGFDSGDEMKITTLGMESDGPINIGFDLGDEMKIIGDVVPKMKRAQKIHGLGNLRRSKE